MYCYSTENRTAATFTARYKYNLYGKEPVDRFLPSTLTTDYVEAALLLLRMGDCCLILCHSLVC